MLYALILLSMATEPYYLLDRTNTDTGYALEDHSGCTWVEESVAMACVPCPVMPDVALQVRWRSWRFLDHRAEYCFLGTGDFELCGTGWRSEE